jgi:hypothetical protein
MHFLKIMRGDLSSEKLLFFKEVNPLISTVLQVQVCVVLQGQVPRMQEEEIHPYL